MPLLERVTVDRGLGHPAGKDRHLFHSLGGLFRPGYGVFGDCINRRDIFLIRHQHIAGGHPNQVFRVASNVHIVIGMNPDPADDQKPRLFLFHILQHLFKRLTIQQGGLDRHLFVFCYRLANLKVGLIDLGQTRIDHLFMQFLLFLKSKDLAGLFGKHP